MLCGRKRNIIYVRVLSLQLRRKGQNTKHIFVWRYAQCFQGITEAGYSLVPHLLSISPVCLNHTMFLPPSSVTVVSTEEVEQGYGMFRTQMLGDTSHLYCAGEPVSHMGYFAEILQERPL